MGRSRDHTLADNAATGNGHNLAAPGPDVPDFSLIPPDRLQALVRLLSDTISANGDRAQRKRQMLTGLCRLLNGQIFIWTQLKDFRPGILPSVITALEGGWLSDDQRAATIKAVYSVEHPDLVWHELALRVGPHFTIRRENLFPDNVWYAFPNVDVLCRAANVDDRMYSIKPIGEPGSGLYSSTCIVSTWAGHRFTEVDRALLHLAMTAIDWLHSADEVDVAQRALEDRARVTPILSNRQREVLLFLMSGNSQKQIAQKMNLSQHTVNDHIKEVYRHFQVTSRSEFQARFMLGESGSPA